jgi:hypothetical protein
MNIISLQSHFLGLFLLKYANDNAYELQVISFLFNRFCLYRFCNIRTACNIAGTFTGLIILEPQRHRFTGSIGRTNDNHLYLCSMPSTLIAQLFTLCLTDIPWSMAADRMARTCPPNYLCSPLPCCHVSICCLLSVELSCQFPKEKIEGWKKQTTGTIQNAILSDVAPCGYCWNRRFGGTWDLHLQCGKNHFILARGFTPLWRWRRLVPPKRRF